MYHKFVKMKVLVHLFVMSVRMDESSVVSEKIYFHLSAHNQEKLISAALFSL